MSWPVDLLLGISVFAACVAAGFLLTGYLAQRRRERFAELRKKTKPGQERAIEIVWVRLFGRQDAPPLVQFIETTGPTYLSVNGNHVYGESHESAIVIAWPVNAKWSTTAFVHELNHVRLMRSGGGWQYDHGDPSWKPGGLVDQGIRALIDEGL
jgi:hypothetical protein